MGDNDTSIKVKGDTREYIESVRIEIASERGEVPTLDESVKTACTKFLQGDGE